MALPIYSEYIGRAKKIMCGKLRNKNGETAQRRAIPAFKTQFIQFFRKYFPDYPHLGEVIPSFLRLIHRRYPQLVWIN